MKEKYEFYKKTYPNYLVLIKSGNFYLALNSDATVLNNIFKYKILSSKNFFKSGFPLSSLNKVCIILREKNVNFIVVNEDVVSKEKFDENRYSEYIKSLENNKITISRINVIYEILKTNLNHKNIKEILNEIEDMLCKNDL